MCLGGEDRFIHLHEHLHVAHSARRYRKWLILATNKFYSLARLRELVGWGVHQHAAVSCPQAAQPQKKLSVYSSAIFEVCQNILQKYGRT